MLEELGRGATGSVRKALYVPELMLVAVKSVHVQSDNRRRQLVRELKSLDFVGNALLPKEVRTNATQGTGAARQYGSTSTQFHPCLQ